VEEVAGAAVGETMATVTPETMAEFSSAFEQIMGDTAVDDLSGYTVETSLPLLRLELTFLQQMQRVMQNMLLSQDQ
jgi:hypothetical protein